MSGAMNDHAPSCPRAQAWDHGEHQAPCTCVAGSPRGYSVRIERIVLPSAIRRGRMATSPVWRVHLADGTVWQFSRLKDARAFDEAGGCPHPRDDGGLRICWECGGAPLRGTP